MPGSFTNGTTITTSGDYTGSLSGGTVTVSGSGVVANLTFTSVSGSSDTVTAVGGATAVITALPGTRTQITFLAQTNSSIELTSGYSYAATDTFGFGPGSKLIVDAGVNISSLALNAYNEASGDAIMFKNMDVMSEGVSYNAGTGYTTVTMYSGPNQTGTVLGVFKVSGDQSASQLGFTYDAATNSTTYCLLRGTSVAVPGGTAQVETLRVGDIVVTASGHERRIKWIGQRTYRAAHLARPDMALPVRIAAGAIADGVPYVDLYVSPDHGMFLDGKLVPARLLINGRSIVQEMRPTFEYFHVELESHDILLAEGMPVESFLSVDQARAIFENPKVAAMYPATDAARVRAAYAMDGFAPLAVNAKTVEPIWRAIAARVGLAVAEPSELVVPTPTPMLIAGARRIAPSGVRGAVHTFPVPAGQRTVVLSSPSGVPSQARPWLDDRRRLGVAVGRIRMRDADGAMDIPLDSPELAAGWWSVETRSALIYRWTDGSAVVAVPERMRDGATLEITVIAQAPAIAAAPQPAEPLPAVRMAPAAVLSA
jgi:hypothetical protein